MNGEPDPAGDTFARRIMGLQFIALGLMVGVAIMTGMFAVILVMAFDGEGVLGRGDLSTLLGYGSLVLVPIGAALAFLVVPGLGYGRTGGPTFAAYSGQYFVQAGMLGGSAVLTLMMFLLTGCWALLGGVAVLLAAMGYIFPTAERYRTWAADHTTAA